MTNEKRSLRDETLWMAKEEDVIAYLNVCEAAYKDNAVLNSFRQNAAYKKILEHTSVEVAENYLKNIKRDTPWLLYFWKCFEPNDSIGTPTKNRIGNYFCSTTTIQYLGVMSDLINRFGDFNGQSIVEIGGGYGGQCRMFNAIFDVYCYEIFDLPQVGMLQKAYLRNFPMTEFSINSFDNIKEDQFDLVISNYALSEILEPLQSIYVEKILLNSKKGYITCNGEIKSLHLLKEKFKSLEISPDIAGERKENYIITWNEEYI